MKDENRKSAEQQGSNPLLAEMWSGTKPLVWSMPDGELLEKLATSPRGVLSGSFNPLHAGHLALRDAAEQWLQGPVYFELPVFNADKPPLDSLTIAHRRRQFQTQPLALTKAPTFVEKSTILPRVTFIVGADTAERIVQIRFYDESRDRMHAALNSIRNQGCRFLIAGRLMGEKFLTLDEIDIPAGFEDLFEELPASLFRRDISSTHHRNDLRD